MEYTKFQGTVGMENFNKTPSDCAVVYRPECKDAPFVVTMTVEVNAKVCRQIACAWNTGRKIDAIKAVRKHYACGLMQAKTIVEEIGRLYYEETYSYQRGLEGFDD